MEIRRPRTTKIRNFSITVGGHAAHLIGAQEKR
jgi:hypothetical protein